MFNVPEGHPLQNPGIEAALVRLGYAIKDSASITGASLPERFNDETAIMSALSYIGISAISGAPPTMAVVLIDTTREKLDQAIVARQEQRAS